jgi:hypothetical protein
MTLHYEVVVTHRDGRQHVREYASDSSFQPGDVIRLEGRYWLLERVQPADDSALPRALAKPARYRLRLRHPDGQEELGAFRRYRPDGPRLGHALTTLEDGQPVSWQVIDERLAHDADGEPYLDLIAERDYSEVEALPDHELEHALARRDADELPPGAVATLSRAEQLGSAVELVALEPGEEPDWSAAERFIDSLVLAEVEDDLLLQCGVNPLVDPRETWLATVKDRLRSDLARFRADIEGNHHEIEEWEFQDGRVFASIGTPEDEANPDSGHGWMCRLVDSEALGAAGFERVRRAEL